jgi:Spy/CpxP family protein refolding chaperone
MKKTTATRSALFMASALILTPGFAFAQAAECSDGWVSNSAHIQGTCSGHGGVNVWLNKEMEEQANQWCDENPDKCVNSHWRGIGGHGNHSADDLSESQPREQKPACDRHFPMDCP